MEIPPLQAPCTDLSDAELSELGELLAAAPAPLEAMNEAMLDGFLCGVIVQPARIAAERWLPWVLDPQGRAFAADPAWAEYPRVRSLILRRHAALVAALDGDGWFDPIVFEADEPQPPGEDGDALALPGPISRPLVPWVVGFDIACLNFGELHRDGDAAPTLARLWRHLPADDDEARRSVEWMDREFPLAGLDEAIADLVLAVMDLADLTREQRYRVDTVRRAAPKVGRNDPCPCGSGRKYKACHGR